MAIGKQVTAPDGDRWRVRRRWLDRPLPNPWRRFRRSQEQLSDAEVHPWDFVFVDDSLIGTIVFAVGALILLFVLLPVLGVAIELVFVLFLLFSGALGRFLLLRPWTIEAENLDDPRRSTREEAKGWRASGEVVERIAREISVSGDPAGGAWEPRR